MTPGMGDEQYVLVAVGGIATVAILGAVWWLYNPSGDGWASDIEWLAAPAGGSPRSQHWQALVDRGRKGTGALDQLREASELVPE